MRTDISAVAKMLSAKDRSAEGLTLKEVAVEIGLSPKYAGFFIANAMEEGLCELAGTRIVRRIDGRRSHTPVYRFTVSEAPKTKSRTTSKSARKT